MSFWTTHGPHPLDEGLCLDDFAGAEAGSADGEALDAAVDNSPDALQIGLEFTFGVLDHVHTDTALFLSQTTAGDVASESLMLSAEFADLSHEVYLVSCLVSVLFMKMVGKTGFEPVTTALKVQCSAD